MKAIITILAVLVTTNTFAIDQKIIDKLQEVLDQQTKQNKLVGVSIGLIDGDETVIIKSGYKDFSTKERISGREYFGIGSISKTFTSLLLSVAVSENKVLITDKVNFFLPQLSGTRAGEITLLELSSHSSGLQRDVTDVVRGQMRNPYEDYSEQDLIKQIVNAKIIEVGVSMEYSNLGVALLSVCLSKIFNMPYDLAIREKVLVPMKLDQIKVRINDKDLDLLTKKYSSSFQELPIWKNLGVFNGVGSFKASTSLMIEYLKAQINPERTLLSKEIKQSQQELREYEGMSAAYGWLVTNSEIGEMFSHEGSTMGFSSAAYFIPEKKKGLVILTNTDATVRCIVTIFIFEEECESVDILSIKATVGREVQGLYVSHTEKIEIKIVYNKYDFLTLRIIGQEDPVRLFKIEEDFYEFYEREGSVEFTRDTDGKIHSIQFTQGESTFPAKKE